MVAVPAEVLWVLLYPYSISNASSACQTMNLQPELLDSTGNQTHQAPADESSGSLGIVSKALLTRIMAVAAFAAIL